MFAALVILLLETTKPGWFDDFYNMYARMYVLLLTK